VTMNDSTNFYDVVLLAQNGDQEAMNGLIEAFRPLIRKVCGKLKYQDRQDIEQLLSEKIIYAVQSYNFQSIPDFHSFCESILKK
jgi:DNA-directed RNA polymerase specialized sigma subunit